MSRPQGMAASPGFAPGGVAGLDPPPWSPRGTGSHRRRLALAGLAGLLVAVLAGIASATAAAASPVFGVRPQYDGKTTLPGGDYSYSLRAGASVDDGVMLTDFTVNPITLDVYGVNATVAGGQLVAGEPAPHQSGVGAWLKFSRPAPTLLAHQSVTDRFRLTVPRGTAPGDYFGAVVAAFGATSAPAGGVALQARAALLVRVHIVGRVHVALTISRPSVATRAGRNVFSVTISNQSNVLITFAETSLRLKGAGTTLDLHGDGLYVIPGGQATLSATWASPPLMGHVDVAASLVGMVNGKPAERWTSPPLSLWFIPWAAIGALLAAGGLVVATNRYWRRWLVNFSDDRRALAAHRRARRSHRQQSQLLQK